MVFFHALLFPRGECSSMNEENEEDELISPEDYPDEQGFMRCP